MNLLQRSTLGNPVLIGLLLLIVALLFRIVDIFILRLDERWGEIILSKSLGFILVVCFLWAAGQGVKSIGLHSEMIIQSLFIGVIITAVALFAGYLLEYVIAFRRGLHPEIIFSAIDPKAGVSGGILFGVWLLLGNVINSFMEEGLFRGVLIQLFGLRLLPQQANWFQSVLFGAWHLPWAVKGWQTGKLRSAGELTFGVISNFLPQLFLGVVWGYMYLKTNSLWAPWISHLLTNSTLNFLHIKTDEGLDSGIAIRMGTYVIVMLMGVWAIKYLAPEILKRNVQN